MWTMGGGEAALLVFAVAVIGWVRRNVIIEWVQPIKLGPIVIRFRSEQRPSGRSTLAVAEEIPSGGPGRDRKKALEDVQKATGRELPIKYALGRIGNRRNAAKVRLANKKPPATTG